MAAPVFAEPHERLALFRKLRTAQRAAAAGLSEHFKAAARLTPPSALGVAEAAAWREVAARLCDEWEGANAEGAEALRRQEAEMVAQVSCWIGKLPLGGNKGPPEA
jgi:hypothetical protein